MSDVSIFPLKTRLNSGDRTLPLKLKLPYSFMGQYGVRVRFLHTTIWEKRFNARAADAPFVIEIPCAEIRWPESAGGLSIELIIPDGSTTRSAVDCQQGPVRYGFVSSFSHSDAGNADAIAENLLKNHITHVQFYDWSYRADQFQPPDGAESYQDAMGKKISMAVVRELIEIIRQGNMKSLGYGAVYAATKEYLAVHPEQGLYDIDGKPFDLIETFYIMNLSNEGWRRRILEQYRYAVHEVGFDGIHMDTYGYPKAGWGYSDQLSEQRELIDLGPVFVSFINEWGRSHTENIFNNVNGWPVEETGNAVQAASYIEVWEPHTRYHHLQTMIARAAGAKKPIVLAAYLSVFKYHPEAERAGLLTVAKLLIASCASLGATVLLLGEQRALLTQPYYPDHIQLSVGETEELRLYSDHLVRYTDLCFDPDLIDITVSHGIGANREFDFLMNPVSHDGLNGTIWVVIKRSNRRIVLHLINLLEQSDDLWDAVKTPCTTNASLVVRLPCYAKKMHVYRDSPTDDIPPLHPLSQRSVAGIAGPMVEVELNGLGLWTTLWVDLIE